MPGLYANADSEPVLQYHVSEALLLGDVFLEPRAGNDLRTGGWGLKKTGFVLT